MMKTSQSLSLGLDSFLSPVRNNKSSANMDTIASLSLSEINQNDNLKLNSIQKQESPRLSVIQLSKISESNVLEPGEPQERLAEMQLMQRWVHQAAQIYELERVQSRQNETKIKKMQHNNRLKKDAAQHLKVMGEYMQKKQKKLQQEIKNKSKTYHKKFLDQIEQSKERVQAIVQDIKILEDLIYEQQRRGRELERELKQSQSSKDKKNPINPNPYLQPMHHHYYHPQNQYQNHAPPYYPHPSHNLGPRVWESEAYAQLRRSPSFEQHPTPQFLSKVSSFNEASNPSAHFPPGAVNNDHFIMQVLAANIQNVANPQLNPSGASRSVVQNTGQTSEYIKADQKKPQASTKFAQAKASIPNLSISQNIDDDQSMLYSPTNIITPQFDGESGFHAFHGHKSAKQQENGRNGQKMAGKYFPALGVEESKIRVDVDDSISDLSKLSIQKKRREQIRQSTIKIDMQQQDSRSGQTSMISDPTNQNTPRLRSPTVDPKNSSFQKICLDQVSCSTSQIFNKPLPAPPKLPPNSLKKLRKVTEQESDLFDSSGLPRVEQKQQQRQKYKQTKQQSETVSVRDMVIDKSQIGVSERFTLNVDNPEGSGLSVSKRKKVTEEDEDDDDFMQINLLAVSKISKEKQYSQAFKTISDDGNEIGDSKKPSMIHKSQNIVRGSQLEDIEQNEQEQFLDAENQKREAQVKRIRKSSGSRFSQIKEPNRQLSLELTRS